MADYQKMYGVLCRAIDSVIDPLEQIPLARESAGKLRQALLEAEEIYIDTTISLREAKEPLILPQMEKIQG